MCGTFILNVLFIVDGSIFILCQAAVTQHAGNNINFSHMI